MGCCSSKSKQTKLLEDEKTDSIQNHLATTTPLAGQTPVPLTIVSPAASPSSGAGSTRHPDAHAESRSPTLIDPNPRPGVTVDGNSPVPVNPTSPRDDEVETLRPLSKATDPIEPLEVDDPVEPPSPSTINGVTPSSPSSSSGSSVTEDPGSPASTPVDAPLPIFVVIPVANIPQAGPVCSSPAPGDPPLSTQIQNDGQPADAMSLVNPSSPSPTLPHTPTPPSPAKPILSIALPYLSADEYIPFSELQFPLPPVLSEQSPAPGTPSPLSPLVITPWASALPFSFASLSSSRSSSPSLNEQNKPSSSALVDDCVLPLDPSIPDVVTRDSMAGRLPHEVPLPPQTPTELALLLANEDPAVSQSEPSDPNFDNSLTLRVGRIFAELPFELDPSSPMDEGSLHLADSDMAIFSEGEFLATGTPLLEAPPRSPLSSESESLHSSSSSNSIPLQDPVSPASLSAVIPSQIPSEPHVEPTPLSATNPLCCPLPPSPMTGPESDQPLTSGPTSILVSTYTTMEEGFELPSAPELSTSSATHNQPQDKLDASDSRFNASSASSGALEYFDGDADDETKHHGSRLQSDETRVAPHRLVDANAEGEALVGIGDSPRDAMLPPRSPTSPPLTPQGLRRVGSSRD